MDAIPQPRTRNRNGPKANHPTRGKQPCKICRHLRRLPVDAKELSERLGKLLWVAQIHAGERKRPEGMSVVEAWKYHVETIKAALTYLKEQHGKDEKATPASHSGR